MRVGKAFFGAAVVAAAMAGPVQAKMAEVPSYNWTGFYFGGGVGAQWLDGDVDVDGDKTLTKDVECADVEHQDGDGHIPSPIVDPINGTRCVPSHVTYGPFPFGSSGDLDGDPSLFGTVIGGFDWQSTRHPRLVIGAFVDADFGDADADFDLSFSKHGYELGSAHGKLKLDYLLTVGGRVGVLSQDYKTLAYGLLGWSHAEFDNGSFAVHVDPPFGFPGVTAYGELPNDSDGLTVGGGVESKLTDRLSLRLEGRATFLGAVSSGFSNSNASTKDGKLFGGRTEIDNTPICGNDPRGDGKQYDCLEKITKTTDIGGSLGIDPDLYSFRAVLTYKFGGHPAALK
jgi:opacity protein-like surface antigen